MNRRTIVAAAIGLLGASMSAASLAQSISVKGSDTMLPLGQGWAAAYMKAKPGRVVTVTGGGSTTGIAGLINGICDIAQASRIMKGSELARAKARGFVPFETPVARDGLAVVVHPSNPLNKITMAQLKAIFSGQAATWKALGGPDQAIVTVGRDSSSGTYGFFQDTVLGIGRPYRPDMQTSPSSNLIGQVVSQDTGAIGYIGIGYAKKFGSKVKVLTVDKGDGKAVEPTEENVRSGKYPLSRYLFFYTRGKPGGAVKDFIDWVRSAEGQAIVPDVGYYKVN
ncbi:MAG: phosphate ABC transporter substrate-binding protein [Chthonomonadales bacterium]|nr:phosphate ABC transporter substrate-binding protein [Chthonomonadales bacterium]